ncbi:MAG: hypothetical protein KKG13_03770, partial [Nanoarchaeota archaeon]|nr:hypothetical protein [Nanoarchaeota archaeon]
MHKIARKKQIKFKNANYVFLAVIAVVIILLIAFMGYSGTVGQGWSPIGPPAPADGCSSQEIYECNSGNSYCTQVYGENYFCGNTQNSEGDIYCSCIDISEPKPCGSDFETEGACYLDGTCPDNEFCVLCVNGDGEYSGDDTCSCIADCSQIEVKYTTSFSGTLEEIGEYLEE